MSNFSRRQLAHYAVEELVGKRPISDIAARLAAALIASGRQKQFDLLLADINQELEDRGLLANAQVTSAAPLTAQLHKELAGKLKSAVGVKNVAIEHRIDKEVIGGLKLQTANHTWDKTLRRLLVNIKESV